MANYYGHARSNYFRVKDTEVFTAMMKSLGLTVWNGENAQEGLVAIAAENSDSGGWPSSFWNEAEDDDVEFDIADIVADHLADGSVAVLQEVGAEKLRYLAGYAVAVNSKGETVSVNIDDIYAKAKTLGDEITPASY